MFFVGKSKEVKGKENKEGRGRKSSCDWLSACNTPVCYVSLRWSSTSACDAEDELVLLNCTGK